MGNTKSKPGPPGKDGIQGIQGPPGPPGKTGKDYDPSKSLWCADGDLCEIPSGKAGIKWGHGGSEIIDRGDLTMSTDDRLNLYVGGKPILWLNEMGANIEPITLKVGGVDVIESINKNKDIIKSNNETVTQKINTNTSNIDRLNTGNAINNGFVNSDKDGLWVGNNHTNSWKLQATGDNQSLNIVPGSNGDNWNPTNKVEIKKDGYVSTKGVFSHHGLGPYKVIFYKKNRCLDSEQFGEGSRGTHDCLANNGNQNWFYNPATGQVRSTAKGQCIDSKGPNQAWILGKCNDHQNQTFRFTNEGLLRAVGSDNKCLDGESQWRQATCDPNNDNQKIKLSKWS